ncbi:MAG: hypothetical protein ALECFALPRED_008313 [Alectoria fallacina]|uniref:Uncharacterized protein n=1 Tax=Alectoria fallacina TaxID=1903189 RepID=A0A8H3I2R3_9LECA|nr:MAG: hypothetical protein ALECFALPRED_008313 [Alectoria fallacina]
MLLLPQLVHIWLPNHDAASQEPDRNPPSEQAPRWQIPPLISFLEGLSDDPTQLEFKAKRFPCGHVVSVRSVLACCNFFGDALWTPGPHFLGCAQPECSETLEFPKLPDPRVIDGLQARLDLIQWSWNKYAPPTELDQNTVSLLRDILSGIGHLTRDPGPETDAELPPGEPSEFSLAQTLALMETEAFGLMVQLQDRKKSAEIPARGTQPYCTYRAAAVPTAGHSQLLYPMSSPGQDCTCDTPHDFEREASSWALTPAETESDPDEPTDEKAKRRKTVGFLAPVVVTEVKYFEPWWCDEYRDSGRYWSTGFHRRSIDLSTRADDEREIERLERPEGSVARMSRELDDQESDCSTVVGNDEEVPDEMERANEAWEDEMFESLDEMEGADESRDDDNDDDNDKVLEETEELRGSWEDLF